MYKEIYKTSFLGATILVERHLAYNCVCSYCIPSYPYVRRVDFPKSFGLMLPENKSRNSWRVFWYKMGNGKQLITYVRWTLPKI